MPFKIVNIRYKQITWIFFFEKIYLFCESKNHVMMIFKPWDEIHQEEKFRLKPPLRCKFDFFVRVGALKFTQNAVYATHARFWSGFAVWFRAHSNPPKPLVLVQKRGWGWCRNRALGAKWELAVGPIFFLCKVLAWTSIVPIYSSKLCGHGPRHQNLLVW